MDLTKTSFPALLDLAESTFRAWQAKKLRPKLDARISELHSQDYTLKQRFIYALRTYRKFLEREVRKRIGFYAAVAYESRSPEMLSKARLDEFRQLIMTSVRASVSRLSEDTRREARAAGYPPESELPSPHQYSTIEAEILDVVNTELRVLESEGQLAGSREQKDEIKPRSKRGPKIDYEQHQRVAAIVGDGEWRSRLHDICDKLDSQGIPCPKPWKQRDDDWLTANRDLRIKAIEHHLKRAREQKETFS